MGKISLIVFFFYACSAQAQMIDLMGSLGIQGAITTGDTQSVSIGLSAVKRNKIIQDINQTAMEIKTQFMGNYNSVGKYSISGNPFNGLNWNLSSLSPNLFYIELNQIDNKTCSYLLSSHINAVRTELNGQGEDKNCINNNQIRFIFD